MVEVAAIMAQAASTAFPPRSKILAPAVAASGLPVTAIQWRPCSAGFCVRPCACGPPKMTLALTMAVAAARTNPVRPSGPAVGLFFSDMRLPRLLQRPEHMADCASAHAHRRRGSPPATGKLGHRDRHAAVRLPAEVRARPGALERARHGYRVRVGPAVDADRYERHVPESTHPPQAGLRGARDRQRCAAARGAGNAAAARALWHGRRAARGARARRSLRGYR